MLYIPIVVINRCLTPHLNKIFGRYFLVLGMCGVTPHLLYRDSLTLIILSLQIQLGKLKNQAKKLHYKNILQPFLRK